MEIITTHFNPDYDALASAIAAKKLFPNAYIVLPGNKERSMKNFFIQTIIYSLDIVDINEVDIQKVKKLIIVDTSRKDRIGIFSEIINKKDVEIIVYDHHLEENEIETEHKFIKKIGACTSLLVKFLEQKQISLTPEEATTLMMGIYEDTGNLTFNTTTEDDYYSAAFLLKHGANLNTVRDILYHDITIEQVEILKQFIETEEVINIRGVSISIVTASQDNYIPEIAVAVHKFKDMRNLPVVIAILRLGSKIYLICRSSAHEISVKYIAEYFGGGGHDSAASAVIKEKTVVEVYNSIKALLLTLDKISLTAKEIMTSPVITITENDNILFANEILNRYNINVLPVICEKDGKLRGLITRQIVGKAIYHNLEELKVKEYMLEEFNTVAPNTNFEKIKDIILKENQRLLPVVTNGKVVGVITRTDILKTIYNIENKNNYIESGTIEKDVKKLLKGEVDESILSKFQILGAVADRLGYGVYVVGGFVRDLMLRRENFDVDLVIEGNGITFAKYLLHHLDIIEKIRTYEKFKTAKIFFKDGLVFDLATARLEYYEKPGSLPIVEKSSLKMDLYRRDFTINTLAIDITKKNFGELIDFFGGVKDLKDKKIRIIHNLSFVEDPTRIFRAFRFACRFDFTIGKQTETLIKNAQSLKLLNTVPKSRIAHELKAIFEEEKVREIIEMLNRYKLLKFVFPKTNVNHKLFQLLTELEEIVNWHKLTFPSEYLEQWILFLMAFVYKLKREDVIETCDTIGLNEKHCAKVANILNEMDIILKELVMDKNSTPYKRYNLLKNKHIESLLFCIARSTTERVKQYIVEFLIKNRFVKPDLTGHDLIAIGLKPSPLFKEIFEKIIELKLNGKIKNINDEKNFVEKNYLN